LVYKKGFYSTEFVCCSWNDGYG